MVVLQKLEVKDIHDIPEYRELVPEPKPEEYQDLVESIEEFGQRDPIIVNQDGVILDGHHRFSACRDLGKQVRFEVRTFENKILERIFVRDANLSRRQLELYSKVTLQQGIAEDYARLGNDNESVLGKLGTDLQYGKISKEGFTELSKPLPKVDTNKEVAKRANTSKDTVTKVNYINKKLNEQPNKVLKRQLELGEKSVNEVHKQFKTQEAKQTLLSETPKIELPENIKLIHGDFIKTESIPANSIDLIFTDPPYTSKSLHVYGDLARIADNVLKDGGSLVTFLGQATIPEVLNLVTSNSENLKYWWIFCVKHSGAHSQMFQKKVFVNWKPMLWFVKGGKLRDGTDSIHDFIQSSPPDKKKHEWAQSPVEAEHVISKLTIGSNQIVLDPFMGSGTTGIATINLNRKFIGYEIDEEKFKIAEASLRDYIVSRNTEIS